MEFPGGLNSNVYEIAEVSKVSWNLCCPSSPGDDAPSEHGIEAWQLDLLQLEAQLRTDGAFVSADFDARGVWVFCPDETTQRDFNNTIALFDLQVHETGLLLSSLTGDQHRTRSESQASLHDTTAANGESASSPGSSNGWDAVTDRLLCAKFIHSIRRSLALTLARTSSSWSMFDQYSCIDVETVGFQNMGDMDHSELMTFESRWVDCGSLLVQAIVRRVPKLHNLADFLKHGEPSMLLDSRFRLLPSCCFGSLRDIESFFDFKPQVSAIQQVKKYLTSFLASFDMPVFYREDWAILGTGTPRGETGDNVLWPAKYCFFETPQEIFDILNGKPDADLPIPDPIERAQAWYNDRFEREKARKAHEFKEKEDFTKLSPAGNTPAVFSPLSHRTYLQDPSAVYPTPPEGFTSSTKDTPAQEQMEDPAGPETGNAAPSELFGEQDLDLTDADFDFFDTPGADPTSDEHFEAPDHQETNRQQHRPSRQTSLSKQKTQTTSHETLPSANESSITTAAAEQQQKREAEALLPTISDASDTQRTRYDPGLLSPALTMSDDASGSVVAQQVPLDEKYLGSGVFGFAVGNSEFQKKAGDNLPAQSRIPQIGFPDGSSSDSEDLESMPISQDLMDIASPADKDEEQNQLGTPGDMTSEADSPIRSLVKAIPMRLLISASYKDTDSALNENECPEAFSHDGLKFMQVAQMLVDQTLKLDESSQKTFDRDLVPWPQRRAYHDSIALSTVQMLFRDAKSYTLDDLLYRFSDLAIENRQTSTALTLLQPPMLRIRRAGTPHNILPSALNLWDDLGLEPAFGPKNVIASCIAWDFHEHLQQPMQHFLEAMQDTYHACNLGTHNLLELELMAKASHDYRDLGDVLARTDQVNTSDTLVVYIIHDSPIPAICSDLLHLIESFAASQPSETASTDLVVQYVPTRVVFDSSCAVPASFEEYKALAFELYDRVAPAKEERCLYDSAPSFTVKRDPPASIEFSMTSDPTSAKLYHDNVLHIGYAMSDDREWLSASWTDNSGSLQWNAVYVIGDSEIPWSDFRRIVAEVIGTTLDMLIPPKLAFRVLVAKHGEFLVDELGAWQAELSDTEMEASHEFNFLSISNQCGLQASLPPSNDPPPEIEETLLTPASTPNTAAMSPEANAATPGPGVLAGSEQDADVRLKDIRDDMWMLLPALMLEADQKTTNGPLPLSEGFLLKRAGLKDGDGICSLSVHLLSSDSDSRNLLEEALGMYHKLSVLARLRKITHRYTGMHPIHVASAIKALKTVRRSMRWTGVDEDG